MVEDLGRRTIFINSKDRSDGTTNDFVVDMNLTDPFFSLQENETLYVYPTRFNILNDFDNVNSYNRTFKLIVENLTSNEETEYIVTLDNGVYSSFTLQSELQTKINETLTNNSIPLTCVVIYDDDAAKYIFTFTGNAWFDNFELRFLFDDVETTLATLMGFREGEYIAGSSTSDEAIFTSSEPINMVFQPEIGIHCSLVALNYQTDTDNTTKPSDLLFSVNQGAKADFITYENQGETYKTISNSQFTNIQIRYLDNLNRAVRFNSDSRLALTFHKIRNVRTDLLILNVLENLEGLTKLRMLRDSLKGE